MPLGFLLQCERVGCWTATVWDKHFLATLCKNRPSAVLPVLRRSAVADGLEVRFLRSIGSFLLPGVSRDRKLRGQSFFFAWAVVFFLEIRIVRIIYAKNGLQMVAVMGCGGENSFLAGVLRGW